MKSRRFISPYVKSTLRFGTAVAALLAVSHAAHAADLMPVSSLEGRARGDVSSAETLRSQGAYSGLSLQTGGATKATAYVGYGVTKNFELDLGLHGTQESAPADGEGQESLSRQRSAGTGFSGASLLTKLRVVRSGNFNLTLAPFIESGAGKDAEFASTRSDKAKLGMMALSSYGARGVGELSLNAGMRLRNAETFGDLTLRDEMFFRAGATGYLSKDFALFAAGSGRRIMAARSATGNGSGDYKPFFAATASGGILIHYGSTDLTAFIGTGLGQEDLSGSKPKTSAGFSVAYVFGNTSRGRSAGSFADGLESDDGESDDAAATLVAGSKNSRSSVDELNATEIDPLADLTQTSDQDDFTMVEAKMKEDAKKAPARTDMVERELGQIHAAEKKAEAERLRKDRLEQELARKNAVKSARANAQQNRKWNKEAQEELDGIEGITKDDVNWKGLE